MAPTILIADSEPDLVGGYARLLRRFGHLCLSACTGLDAIALIDRAVPDLVVADLRLPGADGLAVARHARAHVPPIPVVLITAYDSAWARDAASEASAGAYLPKPFTNAAFLDTVRRVLAGHSPRPGDRDTAGGGPGGEPNLPVCVRCSKPIRPGDPRGGPGPPTHLRCVTHGLQLSSMEAQARAADAIRIAEELVRASAARRAGRLPPSAVKDSPSPRNQRNAAGQLLCPVCGDPVESGQQEMQSGQYLIHADCHRTPPQSRADSTAE